MSEYQSIILATDFSSSALNAAQKAVMIARCCDARLCLLHIISHFPEDSPAEWVAPEDQDPAGYYRDQASKSLQLIAEKLDYNKLDTRVIVSEFSAAHEIVDDARHHHADLIVAGRQGKHGITTLPGSTSSAVMHRADCDVLLVQTQ